MLWVLFNADWRNKRLQVFSADGSFITSIIMVPSQACWGRGERWR